MVEPTNEFHIVKEHPADDIIIATAIIAKADMLITGDKHLLKIGNIKGIIIKQASKL
jgi:predicted nucleic acid-binding protein